MDSLPVDDVRYVKTKIRAYGDKVCINFRGLNISDDGVECKSFLIISIGSLLVNEKKCYL